MLGLTLYHIVTGLFLDGFAGTARIRRRLPANAIGDNPTSRRCAPAHRQHLRLAALHPALLITARAQT